MKGRRIIMAALDWTRPKDPPMSLGNASIVANLAKHNVNYLSRSWSVNHNDFAAQEVSNFILDQDDGNSDVAIGAFVWNEPHMIEILNNLKGKKFSGNIILGGPQVSYVKNGVEKYYPQADIIIRGYAEDPLAQLYTAEEAMPEIDGIHYKGQVDKGISAVSDLEQLPSPYLTGIIKPQRFIRWETQRGCPFRCSFCQHREPNSAMTRREFSLTRIEQEANWITSNPIIQDVAVLDPTFNSGPNFLKTIDYLIAGKYSGKLALQCRMEMVTPEFLDKIEQLNKTGRVVLEFGLQTTNKEEQKLIQRPNNIKKVEQVLHETKNREIETEISLIFGLPNQTIDSFAESINFCKKMGVNKIYAFPLMLLRGTPLYTMKNLLELTESSDVENPSINRIQHGIPHVIASRSFGYEDWLVMNKMASDLEQYNAKEPVKSSHSEITATPSVSPAIKQKSKLDVQMDSYESRNK